MDECIKHKQTARSQALHTQLRLINLSTFHLFGQLLQAELLHLRELGFLRLEEDPVGDLGTEGVKGVHVLAGRLKLGLCAIAVVLQAAGCDTLQSHDLVAESSLCLSFERVEMLYKRGLRGSFEKSLGLGE